MKEPGLGWMLVGVAAMLPLSLLITYILARLGAWG